MDEKKFQQIHEQYLEEAGPAGPEVVKAREKMEKNFQNYMDALEEEDFRNGFTAGYRAARKEAEREASENKEKDMITCGIVKELATAAPEQRAAWKKITLEQLPGMKKFVDAALAVAEG